MFHREYKQYAYKGTKIPEEKSNPEGPRNVQLNRRLDSAKNGL